VNSHPHVKIRHESGTGAKLGSDANALPLRREPARNLKTVDVHVNQAQAAISIKINLF